MLNFFLILYQYNALLSNKSKDLLSRCDKIKINNSKIACIIDGNSSDFSCSSVAGMCSNKYAALYNSVSYWLYAGRHLPCIPPPKKKTKDFIDNVNS